MSGFDDWPPIDNLFCALVDLLGSTKQGRRALDEAIKNGKMRTARYPAFGPGNRWKSAVECSQEWWRGRRLLSGGEILRWTEPDGETEDWDRMIVVCPEDAAALWPSIAAQGERLGTVAAGETEDKKAIEYLAELLEKSPEIKRTDAINACIEHGFIISGRSFQARVWPAARELAGLPRKARPGAKKKS